MTVLRLCLEGEPQSISLRALKIAIDSWLKVLADLDAGISGIRKGSVDWVISAASSFGWRRRNSAFFARATNCRLSTASRASCHA